LIKRRGRFTFVVVVVVVVVFGCNLFRTASIEGFKPN
jgi:hypothetical protein